MYTVSLYLGHKCLKLDRSKTGENYAPEGTVAVFTADDLGRGGFTVIPVGIRMTAAVPALSARKGSEVAPSIDYHRYSLRGCPGVNVGKMGTPSREERSVLEVKIK